MPKVLNKRVDEIPADAVYVGRPSKWGNPMTVKELKRLFPSDTKEELNQRAVIWYREYITTPFGRPKELLSQIGELRGKDLVCWCAPLPCHADVLLELANPKAGDREHGFSLDEKGIRRF